MQVQKVQAPEAQAPKGRSTIPACDGLTLPVVERLRTYAATPKVLCCSVKLQRLGSYVAAPEGLCSPGSGDQQPRLRANRRAPCRICRATVVQLLHAHRGTFFFEQGSAPLGSDRWVCLGVRLTAHSQKGLRRASGPLRQDAAKRATGGEAGGLPATGAILTLLHAGDVGS